MFHDPCLTDKLKYLSYSTAWWLINRFGCSLYKTFPLQNNLQPMALQLWVKLSQCHSLLCHNDIKSLFSRWAISMPCWDLYTQNDMDKSKSIRTKTFRKLFDIDVNVTSEDCEEECVVELLTGKDRTRSKIITPGRLELSLSLCSCFCFYHQVCLPGQTIGKHNSKEPWSLWCYPFFFLISPIDATSDTTSDASYWGRIHKWPNRYYYTVWLATVMKAINVHTDAHMELH